MNKHKKYILILLNTILAIVFLVLLLESFTYSGFLVKHFQLSIGVGIIVLVAVMFLLFKKFGGSGMLRNVIFIITILSMTVYVVSDILEKLTYPNFIFSHFHLQIYLLLLPVIIISFLFLINENKNRIKILLYMTITFVFGQYVVTDLSIIRENRPVFILKNINLSYDKKMEMTVGKVPYSYAIFIRNNTPPDSTILIPPQGFPWDKTGNAVYFRYFLYPRKLINGGEKDPKVDLKNVDYVLIDNGEESKLQYDFTNIWPKFDVDGEYIIYWNSINGTIKKIDNSKYMYDSDRKIDVWGIVKIKK